MNRKDKERFTEQSSGIRITAAMKRKGHDTHECRGNNSRFTSQ